MINEFDDDRMEIRVLLDDEKYTEVLKKCNILEKKLLKKIKVIDKDDLWFVYYDIALMFFKFKEYDKTIEYINKAILYYDSEEQKNLINWLTMQYNIENNINKEQSLLLADEMEDYYIKSNKPIYASNIRVNKASLLCDTEAIKTEIAFVKSIDIMNTKVIDGCYVELFNIYILDIDRNRLEIARVLKSLHSRNLQQKLRDQLTQILKQFKTA